MFNPWHWYLREIWDSPAAGSVCYNYKTQQHFYCPTGTEHYVFAVVATGGAGVLLLALVGLVLMLVPGR